MQEMSETWVLSLGQEDPEPPGKCQNNCLLKTPDGSRNASAGHSWTALDKSHTELDMTEQQGMHTHVTEPSYVFDANF